MSSSASEAGLWIAYLPLEGIRRAQRNPKDHDTGAIDDSMHRFGFVAPMVLNETTQRLVAGHGRLDVLRQRKAAGLPPPAHVREEDSSWMVPVVRGVRFETDEDAEAYLLADNRLSELGGWNDSLLQESLSDLAASEDGLQGTGFDEDELDRMLSNATLHLPNEPAGNTAPREQTCPNCGHSWSG
jgi:hypothetical protein